MDNIKLLLEHQLTEREIMIFLLISSGEISARKLGRILLMDHTQVMRVYNKATQKINALSEAGMFSTEVHSKSLSTPVK